MKIAILSKYDHCFSAYHIAQALRRHTSHVVTLILKKNVKYLKAYDYCLDQPDDLIMGANGYPIKPIEPETIEVIGANGYIIKQKKKPRTIKGANGYPIPLNTSDKAMVLADAQDAVDAADVIIFKGDEPPNGREWFNLRLPPAPSVPRVIVTSGSTFRRKSTYCAEMIDPSAMLERYPMQEYFAASALRCANTPEMNYPEYEGHYAPQSIDSERYEFRWNDRDVPLIMHSPSHRGRKGTDRIFLPALDLLRKKGYKFDFEMVEYKRHDQCVAIKSQATIFLGQIGVGFYSNSALEAMQFGIPTVAWISEAAVAQSDGIVSYQKCPVINAKPDVQHCANKIKRLLSDREYRIRKARATKVWCDKVHSYSATAQRWETLLEMVR